MGLHVLALASQLDYHQLLFLLRLAESLGELGERRRQQYGGAGGGREG